MNHHQPSDLLRSAELLKIAHALGELRDSLLMLSLALTDLTTELPSRQRDEALVAVKQYLKHMG
jgi:hypothetical protein